MKTKKFIQALTALALCATMTAPVNAFASAVTMTPGKGALVEGDSVEEAQTGKTPIRMEVTAQYIITIPATVILYDNASETVGTEGDYVYTGSGVLTVSDIHLNPGQNLVVNVGNSVNQSFNLTADNGATIEYEASTSSSFSPLLGTDSSICTYGSESGDFDKTDTIYFRTKDPVTNAGSYDGNFTFHFSVQS